MILLIHEQSKSILSYIKFLEKNNIKYYDVTLHELINYVEISDGINFNLSQVAWKTNQAEIVFSELSGIYHDINPILSMSYFNRYQAADREYAREEWLSYLLFRLKKQENINIINPLSPDFCSGLLSIFPYIFRLAEHSGFIIPNYQLIYNHEDNRAIKKFSNFYGKTNLFSSYIFQRKNSITNEPVAIIEYITSAPIFVIVIGDTLFATICYKEGLEIFNLPEVIQQACFSFMEKTQLDICEICLHRTYDNHYIFYGFSTKLDWDRCVHEKEDIYSRLTRAILLSRNNNDHKINYMTSFIEAFLRKKE